MQQSPCFVRMEMLIVHVVVYSFIGMLEVVYVPNLHHVFGFSSMSMSMNCHALSSRFSLLHILCLV